VALSDEEQLSEAQAVLMELVDTGDSLLNRTSFVSAQNGLARWVRSVERALDALEGGEVLAAEWQALPVPTLTSTNDGVSASEEWAPLQQSIHTRIRWLWGTIRVLENPPEPAAIDEEEEEEDLLENDTDLEGAEDDADPDLETTTESSESIVDFDDLLADDEEEDEDLDVAELPADEAPPAEPAASVTMHNAPAPLGSAVAPSGHAVVVVHGRDDRASRAVAEFLQALGLQPLGWADAVAATGRMMPSADEVIERALSLAQAIVVLMTGEDEAKLRDDFVNDSDPPHESQLTPQARLEVIFAAGLALGRAPQRTIIVEIGTLRPFSANCGAPVIRLDDSSQRRYEFFKRLEAAGCHIELKDKSWHTAGTFHTAA
jgi:hypothetical protein